jgi:glutathione S-transferase
MYDGGMPGLTLVIGNKNYSSWSLRPWVLMKQLHVEFEELFVRLDTPDFKDELASHGPTGRVPVLKDGDLAIWDSLAICEYLDELASRRGWPHDTKARAVARAVSAEMHSGFTNLRTEWPMNARARNRGTPMTPGLISDIERIDEMWNDCRRRFGAAGPWLFGGYSIADAMFAPVVLRFNTYSSRSYGAQLSETARWYIATAMENAALQEWIAAAQKEPWTNPAYEVGK